MQIPAEMIHYGMTKTAQTSRSRAAWPSRSPARASRSTACCPGRPSRAASATSSTALAKASGKRFEQVETEFFENVRPTSLIKRFASPEEVAALVAYVASPLASATTGAALRVDGGVVKSAF